MTSKICCIRQSSAFIWPPQLHPGFDITATAFIHRYQYINDRVDPDEGMGPDPHSNVNTARTLLKVMSYKHLFCYLSGFLRQSLMQSGQKKKILKDFYEFPNIHTKISIQQGSSYQVYYSILTSTWLPFHLVNWTCKKHSLVFRYFLPLLANILFFMRQSVTKEQR